MKLPLNYDNLTYPQRKSVREEYIKQQDGNCYFCKDSLKGEPAKKVSDKTITEGLFPPSFFKWPVHLHHSHDTGMTIGAVHCYCNAVLWEYHHE